MVGRIQVRGARRARPMAGSPRYRRGVDEERADDTTRPITPIEQAWRCAHDRQGQVAARRPSAALDRRSAQRLREYQVGTRRCRRPVEQGDAPAKMALTPSAPYKSKGRLRSSRALALIAHPGGCLRPPSRGQRSRSAARLALSAPIDERSGSEREKRLELVELGVRETG